MQCISANASNLVIKRIIISFQCVDILSITQFDIKNLHDAEKMTLKKLNCAAYASLRRGGAGIPPKRKAKKIIIES